jgi:ankyrin repeat protein
MPADSFESPLTLAACGGHVELASLLIERGANLEEVNDEKKKKLISILNDKFLVDQLFNRKKLKNNKE